MGPCLSSPTSTTIRKYTQEESTALNRALALENSLKEFGPRITGEIDFSLVDSVDHSAKTSAALRDREKRVSEHSKFATIPAEFTLKHTLITALLREAVGYSANSISFSRERNIKLLENILKVVKDDDNKKNKKEPTVNLFQKIDGCAVEPYQRGNVVYSDAFDFIAGHYVSVDQRIATMKVLLDFVKGNDHAEKQMKNHSVLMKDHPDFKNETIAHVAVRANDIEMFKVIIEYDFIDFDRQNSDGENILHLICSKNRSFSPQTQLEYLQSLVSSGNISRRMNESLSLINVPIGQSLSNSDKVTYTSNAMINDASSHPSLPLTPFLSAVLNCSKQFVAECLISKVGYFPDTAEHAFSHSHHLLSPPSPSAELESPFYPHTTTGSWYLALTPKGKQPLRTSPARPPVVLSSPSLPPLLHQSSKKSAHPILLPSLVVEKNSGAKKDSTEAVFSQTPSELPLGLNAIHLAVMSFQEEILLILLTQPGCNFVKNLVFHVQVSDEEGFLNKKYKAYTALSWALEEISDSATSLTTLSSIKKTMLKVLWENDVRKVPVVRKKSEKDDNERQFSTETEDADENLVKSYL